MLQASSRTRRDRRAIVNEGKANDLSAFNREWDMLVQRVKPLFFGEYKFDLLTTSCGMNCRDKRGVNFSIRKEKSKVRAEVSYWDGVRFEAESHLLVAGTEEVYKFIEKEMGQYVDKRNELRRTKGGG